MSATFRTPRIPLGAALIGSLLCAACGAVPSERAAEVAATVTPPPSDPASDPALDVDIDTTSTVVVGTATAGAADTLAVDPLGRCVPDVVPDACLSPDDAASVARYLGSAPVYATMRRFHSPTIPDDLAARRLLIRGRVVDIRLAAPVAFELSGAETRAEFQAVNVELVLTVLASPSDPSLVGREVTVRVGFWGGALPTTFAEIAARFVEDLDTLVPDGLQVLAFGDAVVDGVLVGPVVAPEVPDPVAVFLADADQVMALDIGLPQELIQQVLAHPRFTEALASATGGQ